LVRAWSSISRQKSIPTDRERLWLCLALIPCAVFTTVACFRPVLPHWGLIGLVSLFPTLGRHWADRLAASRQFWPRRLLVYAGVSMAIAVLTIIEFHSGILQRGGESRWGLLDARSDPTIDLYGWDQVAGRMKELGLIDDPRTFVFARYWYQSAQLACALGPSRSVYCYNADDSRGFAFWNRPEESVGQDGVLVLVGNEPEVVVGYYALWFVSVERVSEFSVLRNGKPVRQIRLYRCTRQRRSFPFGPDRIEQVTQRSGPNTARERPKAPQATARR
jgi:hypothetical protein